MTRTVQERGDGEEKEGKRFSSQMDLPFSLLEIEIKEYPDFPWEHAYAVLNSTSLANLWL